jgi:hypothetical protein
MKQGIKTLLDTGNKAIIAFTKKDLLGEDRTIVEPASSEKNIEKTTARRFMDLPV